MTTETNPQILAWLDQEDRNISSIVRRHGWAVQYVVGEENSPPFAYTIGLFGLGHPELIIFGLDYSSALHILNSFGARVKTNRDLSAGEILTIDGTDTRARVAQVPNPGQILFSANRFYQRPDEASVPAFQLTWDVEGAFPGEPGYSKPEWLQPAPGEFRA